jgi:hypothetical protein
MVGAMLSACGSSGDHASSDGGSPDSGGTVDDNPRNVSGSFFIGDSSRAAAGYELLLVDWNDNTMRSFVVASDGSVSLDLSEFAEERVYSLHLIAGDRKIGDLDLSAVNDGLQSAFNYRGGYGFSLGEVIVPLNAHGLIAVPPAGLAAAIGGGFSLTSDDRALQLEDIPAPSLLSSLSVQPTLVVSRGDDLYHGFLNVTDPAGAAVMRARYQGVSLTAQAAQGQVVERVFSSRIADWQTTAVVLPSAFDDLSTATPWNASAFVLEKSGAVFSAQLIPGRDILNRLIFLRVEGEDPPQIEIPRVVASGFSRPAVTEAISLTAGTPVTIDYSDTTAENGAIRPFCHSAGDVNVTFSLPSNQDGDPVDGETLDQIALMPVYYSQASGVTSAISDSASLASPFDADIAEASDGDYLRSWTAAAKTLTFAMTAANLTASQHTLTLPAALFPASLGGKTVTRVKMRYLFKAKNHSGKSGSVIWFRKNC